MPPVTRVVPAAAPRQRLGPAVPNHQGIYHVDAAATIMPLESLQTRTGLRDRSGLAVYGSVLAVVPAALLLEGRVTQAYDAVATRTTAVAGERFVPAVATAVLGTAVVGLAGWAHRARSGWDRGLAPAELVTLAGASGFLGFATSFWLMGQVGVTRYPSALLRTAIGPVVALVVPAVAFTRLRGRRLRVGDVDRRVLLATAAAGSLGVGVALGHLVVTALAGTTGFPGPFLPRLTLDRVVLDAVFPALVGGVGLAVLYNGAIQEALRARLGLAGAVAAVTTISPTSSLLLLALLRRRDPLAGAGVDAGVGVLAVLVAVLTALAARRAADSLSLPLTPAVAAGAGALVALAVAVGVALLRPGFVPIVAIGLALAIVAGVAAVGYERTRSVWVPAAAFATFQLVAGQPLATAILNLLV